MADALSIELEAHGLKLKGWLGSPALLRRQADCQYFFVNQRMVKDRLLNHAIKSIYLQNLALEEGTYPSYILYLSVDPSEVDVNVHPTKQEVRFSEPRHIHDFISKAIGDGLGQTSVPLVEKQQSVPLKATQIQTQIPIRSESPQNAIKMQGYALIEDEQGVIVCSLVKGKVSLLDIYLKQAWGNMPRKNLLFPQDIVLPNHLEFNENIMMRLAEVGYWVKVNQHHLLLLAAPIICLSESTEAFLLALIEQIAIDSEKDHLCEWLAVRLSVQSLQALDNETFSRILNSWVSNTQPGAWRRLSHSEFDKRL
jgi:DNA mismatch repair ATPase MutL